MPRLGPLRARIVEVGGALATGEARAGARPLGERRGLLVRVEDGGGAWGQGEASPLPHYSPDTFAQARAELAAADWGAAAELELDQPAGALLAELARRLPLRSAAARFGVETAVLDLLGRRRGQAVSTLLRGGAPATDPIALSALLPDGDPDAVAEATRAARARGIDTVKLKVGRPGALARELELVRAALAALGPGGRLRLDANRGWSPAEAAAALAALAPLSIELVEEPTADWRDLPLPAPVRVGADESLQAPDAEGELGERAARGGCHALVLKPAALGGIGRYLRLAHLAAERGLGVCVTHLFDGPIGLAAAAELALALPGAPLPCGLVPHTGLAVWPAAAPPQLTPRAVAPAPVAGLGLPDLAPLLEAP